MNFIVDAHIPIKVSQFIIENGHNSIHTSELPNRNETPDKEIRELSKKENRVVITKDLDFYHSHVLNKNPSKLILLKVGNISTSELIEIIKKNLSEIVSHLNNYDFIELHRKNIKIL